MSSLRKCNRCGTESGDDAQFCHKCGNTLTVGAYQQKNQPPMLYQPYTPPSKKDNTGLVLAVLVVVVLAISMVVAAFAISDAVRDMPWDEWTDNNVDMSVDSPSSYTNLSDPPVDGYVYVRLTVTIDNQRDAALTLGPDHFLLYTSDNQYYGYSTAVPDSVPASIESGASETFFIGFMIPESSVPSVLKMDVQDDMFGTVTAVIPS